LIQTEQWVHLFGEGEPKGANSTLKVKRNSFRLTGVNIGTGESTFKKGKVLENQGGWTSQGGELSDGTVVSNALIQD